MVKINRSSSKKNGLIITQKLVTKIVIFIGVVYFIIGASVSLSMMDDELETQGKQLRSERVQNPNRPTMVALEKIESRRDKQNDAPSCFYKSLADVSEDELQPVAGQRHMVTPPIGGKLTLVCCETTAGPLSIAVHEQWAPIGAQFFLEMVTTGYFNAGIGVPFMRCVKNFLCQVRKCSHEAVNGCNWKGKAGASRVHLI
jgi:hypothetical protein